MKRNLDYPEYEEYKSFRLTNEQRPYFGLDLIDADWEEAEIKEGMTVFYAGDVIKKIIAWENHKRFQYQEYDTELMTRDRQYVLPKTVNGKEKKLTPTSVLSVAFSGCIVSIALKTYLESHISAYCPRNNIHLPITEDEGISTIADLQQWINTYITTCPQDYMEKVQKMRTLGHRTIKFKAGDIFRFEIDREHYGFGLIIGKLRELQKRGAFSEAHPMLNIMSVPLFIRLYLVKTKDKAMQVSQIIGNHLLAAEVMSDNSIIWGTHDIIGSKSLEEKDIDFPMQFGLRIDGKQQLLRFAWGMGMITIQELDHVPADLLTIKYLNHGVATGVPIHKLERALQGKTVYDLKDLRHPEHKELKNKVFRLLNLPLDTDLDSFNNHNNGMTRREYIDFIR